MAQNFTALGPDFSQLPGAQYKTPPGRLGWRTTVLFLTLALPSAALACSPSLPTIPWETGAAPEHWQTRSCAPDWQAKAGEFGQVSCYRLPAGTSATRIIQDAWHTAPDQLLSKRLGPQHLRLTRTFGSEEMLDIHDKGRAGVFVNFLQRGSAQEYVRRQLRQVALKAESSGTAVGPRHAWLRLLLGDERPDCREFAPLDTRLVADCRVEWRSMRSEDMTGGGITEKTAPLLVFRWQPSVQAMNRPPYAAYLADSGVCGSISVLGLRPQDYAEVWPL
ncbi:hypothetical protein GCM10017783_05400 [Deinococcus piscis]|uniref:Uncharacterized protein n=1 Tax=Deinococcus piscis TaxID=394230 RepID=A0ABQ3JYZ9_9DEIO|nr:hypothetical protein GCM10017783_05400 [Deinococcus piscis]